MTSEPDNTAPPAEAPVVTGGAMSWTEAVTTHLGTSMCLWQDLDGLHIEPAPTDPPPTSILWAWAEQGAMTRVRLDQETAYVARCDHAHTGRVLPWAAEDGRVHSVRPAAKSTADLGFELEVVVLDGVGSGTGPITFMRPAAPGDTP